LAFIDLIWDAGDYFVPIVLSALCKIANSNHTLTPAAKVNYEEVAFVEKNGNKTHQI